VVSAAAAAAAHAPVSYPPPASPAHLVSAFQPAAVLPNRGASDAQFAAGYAAALAALGYNAASGPPLAAAPLGYSGDAFVEEKRRAGEALSEVRDRNNN
jgi:hypothetical protein